MIFPAPFYNSRTGHVYQLPADTVKNVDDFPPPAGFRREWTRQASFVYSIGVYVEPIDENTKLMKQVTIETRYSIYLIFFQVYGDPPFLSFTFFSGDDPKDTF